MGDTVEDKGTEIYQKDTGALWNAAEDVGEL